ncbi:MAG: circularly permuted type 2 ATP-grasp protein [Rhodospirillaceae bacterium]
MAAYDEMVSGKRSLRPHWREIMSLVWGMPPEMLREKQARAVSHLAAADSLFEGGEGQPHWGMDLLPLILPEAEWQVVADGLAQRAKLLNLILADIYGPQTLIRDKLLPPFLVFNNPKFLRPLRFVASRAAPPLHFYGADLVRMPNGRWRVLADRTQAPGGVGYALRHRSVAARSFPEAFRNASIYRLQPSIDIWQASLQSMGAQIADDARMVLLTPGPHNTSYPEHVLLAQELGMTLAQGDDLTVREGMVYLRTLDGLVRVHVIYRRVDGDYCDPLELRPDSALGVAGLIAAVRAGNVALVNLPGSAVVETPAFASFLPAIARHLLGEELALPAVTTWWCGQREPLEEVLKAPERFVLQSAFHPDVAPMDLAKISAEERAGNWRSCGRPPANMWRWSGCCTAVSRHSPNMDLSRGRWSYAPARSRQARPGIPSPAESRACRKVTTSVTRPVSAALLRTYGCSRTSPWPIPTGPKGWWICARFSACRMRSAAAWPTICSGWGAMPNAWTPERASSAPPSCA